MMLVKLNGADPIKSVSVEARAAMVGKAVVMTTSEGRRERSSSVHTIVWALFAGCILAFASLCTQAAGETSGQCVLGDGMATFIQRIETADGQTLINPVQQTPPPVGPVLCL